MLIYIFFFVLIILADAIKIQSRFLLYSIIIFVGIFLCFGYMSGSDWREYELEYNNLLKGIPYDASMKIGYLIYMYPFVSLGIYFWHFFIFTKIILYLTSIYFLKKYVPDNFYFAFLIFYCYMGVYLFIDNPMRFFIASTIYLFAFKFVLDKNFKKYLLVCFAASLFHASFALFIPLYFVVNKSYKTRNIVIAFIAFNILLFVFGAQLINLFKSLDFLFNLNSQKLNEQVSSYVLSDSVVDRQFTFGLLAKYVVFIILILFKDRIVSQSKYGNIAFNCSILSLFILRFALIWAITVRFVIPLSIFYCITIAMVISYSKGYSKLMYYFIFLIIYFGALFSQVTSAAKYIPYTSYLYYIGFDKPSYYYRDRYNDTHSPFKK